SVRLCGQSQLYPLLFGRPTARAERDRPTGTFHCQRAGQCEWMPLGVWAAKRLTFRPQMGLPYWLSTDHSDIQYRTSDTRFLNYAARWYDQLLPKLVPLLYENGGPILMGQVENEYGSYWACDFAYTTWLRDLFRRYLGPTFLLFTVDGNSDSLLSCGRIDEVY